MIDPDADPGRRAWINCTACDDHSGWVYLLGYEVGNLFCQCPTCGLRFWWDSGFGAGGAPQRAALWWPLAS